MDTEFSVVIPVHNEEGNIGPLHAELIEVFDDLGQPYEIIYVNDGSTDGSLAELRTLPKATVIDLRRRYKKAIALMAGFGHASGNRIITLDGDGQNDPRDIPALLRELEDKELDVVAGWRVKRRDRGAIRFITGTGRRLRKALLDDRVSDSGCALRVYHRAAVESLDLHGEMDRYIPALLVWRGFRIGELPVNDRPRVHGKSKYGVDKAVRAFIDLLYLWFLYKYSQRPLHLFGYAALVTFGLSLASGFITLYDRLYLGTHLNRDGWFFLTFFFFIAGMLFFSFGLVLDLLMRTNTQVSAHERSHIRTIYPAE